MTSRLGQHYVVSCKYWCDILQFFSHMDCQDDLCQKLRNVVWNCRSYGQITIGPFFRTRCRFVKNLCMAYIASWRNMLTRSGVEATSSWKLKMCTQCFTVSIWWVWNNSMNTHLTTKPNDYISGSTEKITFGLNEMTFSSWRTGSQDITCREAIAVYLFTIRWQGCLVEHMASKREPYCIHHCEDVVMPTSIFYYIN